jgi:hypothetical protein
MSRRVAALRMTGLIYENVSRSNFRGNVSTYLEHEVVISRTSPRYGYKAIFLLQSKVVQVDRAAFASGHDAHHFGIFSRSYRYPQSKENVTHKTQQNVTYF